MLTTTYAFAAISIEQKNARSMLLKLEQKIHENSWIDEKIFDLSYLKTIFSKLIQFDKYCRARKTEVYIIPAIRKATSMMDSLLDELESLSSQALRTIRSLYDQISLSMDKGVIQLDLFFSTIQYYCQNLHERLNKEDRELFPTARHLLSLEQWFTIAVECLSEETKNRNRSLTIKAQEQDFYDMPPKSPLLNMIFSENVEIQNVAQYSAA